MSSWSENGPKLADLVGATPIEMWVGPEERELRLKCSDGRVFVLDTYGDCCSETWWADAVGVKQLLGHVVTAVEEIDMPTPEDDRTRQEYDEAYGIKITTTRGVCDLVYRNSSNGYYGGDSSIRWSDKIPDGFRQITEDWSA